MCVCLIDVTVTFNWVFTALIALFPFHLNSCAVKYRFHVFSQYDAIETTYIIIIWNV